MGGGGWGAVAQIGTDIASSALQAHLSLKMQSRAFGHARSMYSRRYRRTMEDMRLAGLNPILAYRQGPGAGSPGAGGGGIGGTPQGAGRAVTSSLKFRTEMKILQAQKKQIEMQTFKDSALGHQAGAQAQTIDESRPFMVNSARAMSQIEGSRVPAARADEAFYKSTPGQWTRFLQRLLQGVRGGAAR